MKGMDYVDIEYFSQFKVILVFFYAYLFAEEFE